MASGDARLKGLNAAAHERAAPQVDRVLAHPERLGDPGAGPAPNRHEDRSRPVRFGSVRPARLASSATISCAAATPNQKLLPLASRSKHA
jgi:hypothetical protein